MKTRRNRNLRYSIVLHVGVFRNRLQPTVKLKRRGLWSSGLCLQRDKARCLTAVVPQNRFWFQNAGVSPSAIFARFSTRRFSPLWHVKDSLRGRHFRSDEKANEAEQDWLVQQP
jgi:hypothetical protein